MTYSTIADFLVEGSTNDLISESDESLLDVTDFILEAVEEHSGFDKDLEDLQFYNQDHTNNLDDDTIANLDPDNTEVINNNDLGDDELASGMEIVTISEGSLLEQLLKEADVSEIDVPLGDTDVEPSENPLDTFTSDDIYDTTNLEDY